MVWIFELQLNLISTCVYFARSDPLPSRLVMCDELPLAHTAVGDPDPLRGRSMCARVWSAASFWIIRCVFSALNYFCSCPFSANPSLASPNPSTPSPDLRIAKRPTISKSRPGPFRNHPSRLPPRPVNLSYPQPPTPRDSWREFLEAAASARRSSSWSPTSFSLSQREICLFCSHRFYP
jgi:hypothetical protein